MSQVVAPLVPAADEALTEAVRRLYARKPGMPAGRIRVAVTRGIVLLTGTTDTLLSLEQAGALAKAVPGVRGVVNDLHLQAAEVPDDVLRQQLNQTLADAGLVLPQVQVHVEHAAATLSGVVDSWPLKQWLLRLVKSAAGLWHVEDQLSCLAASGVRDAGLAPYLDDQLAWATELRAAGVDGRVQPGRGCLRGQVESADAHARLVATAGAAGAAVDAEPVSIGAPAGAAAPLTSPRLRVPDEACAQAILDTWQLDPRLGAERPGVRVQNGVTTLTGAVDTIRARQAAEQDARNTVGTWHVNNYLRVWPRHLPDDAAVQQALRAAQAQDPEVAQYAVEWVVDHGRAILRGPVPSHAARQRLEELAGRVPGVLSVISRLRLPAQVALPWQQSTPPTELAA